MELESDLLKQLRKLSPDDRRQVLDFAEHLARKGRATPAMGTPRGLFKDLGPGPSADDLADARREAWGAFPRDDV
jgi:hypothetical protein